MLSGGKSELSAINTLIIVFVLANVAIILLSILNYMQDGKLSLTSVIIGLMVLSSALITRASLKKKL
ncbi:MAG: hypothetical protein M3209_18040 [Acidobacteriota bacterium]|nr:hypothetical protein [Acidobacteriota bacterium]